MRPKQVGGTLPALPVLENRELFGSLIPELALAAGGVALAGRLGDAWGESAWVDFSVSGGLADTRQQSRTAGGTVALDTGISVTILRPVSDDARWPDDDLAVTTTTTILSRVTAPAQFSSASSLTAPIILSPLDDAVSSVMPRLHAEVRNLRLHI